MGQEAVLGTGAVARAQGRKKPEKGTEEARVSAGAGSTGHPGPGPVPWQGATCVDEFVPLQVPDAVEDAPADLTRVDVPASGRELGAGRAAGCTLPHPFLSKGEAKKRLRGGQETRGF